MTDELLPAEEELEPESAEESPAEKNWPEEARKFQDLYLRCAAETENMRRRLQKERDEQARYASERVLKDFLPVLDNLYLALGYARDDGSAEVQSLAEGLRLTLKGFQDVLQDNGVRPVPAERGQAFDPNLHEALGQAPAGDIPPGAISQLVQRGYTLYDRLIRPAKVLVAVAPD
ncbi:MAG: nucleotide exchange factor GrpE [Candidatus Adiutrix sp.]|jgi:molecular chaperone GrpE|nr:nucleotide exchange factor GrpE [Candidatus Adiutrix sp.]